MDIVSIVAFTAISTEEANTQVQPTSRCPRSQLPPCSLHIHVLSLFDQFWAISKLHPRLFRSYEVKQHCSMELHQSYPARFYIPHTSLALKAAKPLWLFMYRSHLLCVAPGPAVFPWPSSRLWERQKLPKALRFYGSPASVEKGFVSTICSWLCSVRKESEKGESKWVADDPSFVAR